MKNDFAKKMDVYLKPEYGKKIVEKIYIYLCQLNPFLNICIIPLCINKL